MGRITDEDIARVRDATDLVALVSERVVLRQKGRLFWGNCPFHGEKTPSFKIDPATQLWHCFGCGAGGDAFGFLMRSESLDFPDAVRLLADRAHIELHESEGGVPRGTKERLYAALAESAAFFHRTLTGSRDAGAGRARDYLAGRGFGTAVANSWDLGYAPGRGALCAHLTKAGFTHDEMVGANVALRSDSGQMKDRFYERIMFPIRDVQGRVVGFGGRVVGSGEPKYLNTNDTPVFRKSANLYAIDRAKGPITASGTALVVEGYTDVIALHEAGINNVVATLGTALTQQHVRLLGRFARRIVYVFDGDEAGMRAAERAVEFVDRSVTPEAGSARVELLVAVLPEGADPADAVATRGPAAIQDVVHSAQPLLEFAIDRRLARWDLERPEERARALADAAAVLAPIKESLLADDYANHIADRLFADYATVKHAISRAKARPPGPERADDLAVPSGDAAGASAAGGGLVDPMSIELKTARDLIALLLEWPALRPRAQELLAETVLSDPSYRAMVEVIAGAPAGERAATLVGRMEEKVPGAGRVLSGATLTAQGEEVAGELVSGCVMRLKEFDIERRIAVGRARLKSPAAVKDRTLSDEILKDVAELQRELDAVRRSPLR